MSQSFWARHSASPNDRSGSLRLPTFWDKIAGLYDLAELFKVFGDSTRIKILYALFEAELCVCDISRLLGLTQSAVSHQLRVLKNSRLVKFRKEGKTVFYSLADDHVRKIIAQGMEHVNE